MSESGQGEVEVFLGNINSEIEIGDGDVSGLEEAANEIKSFGQGTGFRGIFGRFFFGGSRGIEIEPNDEFGNLDPFELFG